MSKKKMFAFAAFLVLVCGGALYADKDPTLTAPKGEAGALIIYNTAAANSKGTSNNGYSEQAMETFRAALGQNLSYITFPGANVSGGIPTIDPPLKMVSILACTKTTGFDQDLKDKFYGKGQKIIDGQNHNGKLFDSLYNAGNPLSYWQSVYDLRFWDGASTNISSISTGTQKTSDYSYYKELLKAGGALFLQAEYNIFGGRNNGVIYCINNFTKETGLSSNNIGQGVEWLKNFNFGTFEDFNKDFNNLDSLLRDRPMLWAWAGGYPTYSLSSSANHLVTSGSLSVIIIWGTEGMAPEIGNGRLIVAFDINAWGDYGKGVISRTTMGLIQNIYDLMRGTSQYGVYKTFNVSEASLNELVTCNIVVKNTASYEIDVGYIIDTLSSCFEYVSPTTGPDAPTRTALSNGRVELKWLGNKVEGLSERKVSFEVRVKKVPPSCN